MIEKVDSDAPDRRVDESLVGELLHAQRNEMLQTHAGKYADPPQPEGAAWRTSIRHALTVRFQLSDKQAERMFTNSSRLPMDSNIPESVSTDSTDNSDSGPVLVADPPEELQISTKEKLERARRHAFGPKEAKKTEVTQEEKGNAQREKQKKADQTTLDRKAERDDKIKKGRAHQAKKMKRERRRGY